MAIITLNSENVYLAWLSNSVRHISLELHVLSYITGLLMEDTKMVNSPTVFVINSYAVSIKHNFQISLNNVHPSLYHFATIHFTIKGVEIILSAQYI